MATEKRKRFNYIAHIQKGTAVTEHAGSREDTSVSNVYHYLASLAEAVGGWLLADSIVEDGKPDAPVVRTSVEQDKALVPVEQVPDTVGADSTVWGVYTNTYTGASQLTFKEKEDG